ncbi:hypothetical protein [Spirosoma gilvum]
MITYYIRIIGFIVAVLLTTELYSQSVSGRLAKVSNIRLEVDTVRAKIQYDISGLIAADSVYIQVESRSAGLLVAKTVTGDVGKAITSGFNKTIYWDYRLDGLTMVDDIRVTIHVKQAFVPGQRIALGGGPANALVSAVLPGLGNIFVQPNHKVGLRPLITVAYAGLLVYGLVQRNRSQQQLAIYQNQLSESVYDDANQFHHQYLLATRAAALVWAADVVYTFLKGRKNQRERLGIPYRIVVNYVSRTPVVGLQLSF